jgi:hypothetical protein
MYFGIQAAAIESAFMKQHAQFAALGHEVQTGAHWTAQRDGLKAMDCYVPLQW